MKIILTDSAEGNTTASSTNPNFPISNMFNEHPKQVWKANSTGVSTITITGTTFEGNSDYAIFNAPGLIANIHYTLKLGAATVETGDMTPGSYFDFWLDPKGYTPAQVDTIVFTLEADISSYATIGILRMGNAANTGVYDNPQQISYSYKDYSIIKRTRNQAMYIKEKDKVDMFNGTVVSKLRNFHAEPQFVWDCKALAPYPGAIKLLDTKSFDRFVFGLIKAQSGAYRGEFPKDGDSGVAQCNFSIEEVI